MIDEKKLRQAVNRYLDAVQRQSTEDYVACFAKDGSLEDPVGRPAVVGHDAIAAFFEKNIKPLDAVEVELFEDQVRVSGRSVAVVFKAIFTGGGRRRQLIPIEVQDFDDEGLITSMRAYWGRADMVEL